MNYFPTFRYHKEQGAIIFQSDSELAAAGAGWADTPGRVETGPYYPDSDAKRLGVVRKDVDEDVADNNNNPDENNQTGSDGADDVNTDGNAPAHVATGNDTLIPFNAIPVIGISELQGKTLPELRMIAAEQDPPIKGYQRMNANTLIARLTGAQ